MKHYTLSVVQFSDECIREVAGLLHSLRNHKEHYEHRFKRAIRVVYSPTFEDYGNYVPSGVGSK